jgi:hypothetical protein
MWNFDGRMLTFTPIAVLRKEMPNDIAKPWGMSMLEFGTFVLRVANEAYAGPLPSYPEIVTLLSELGSADAMLLPRIAPTI